MLGPMLLVPYINDLPDYAFCNIAIYAGNTYVYSECDPVTNWWQQPGLTSEL